MDLEREEELHTCHDALQAIITRATNPYARKQYATALVTLLVNV
jgi:hypothetical protein